MVKRTLSSLKNYPRLAVIGFFLILAIFLLLTGNLLSSIHNCFDVYDLGIYHQAITELSLENLNPYLTVRNLKVFNDHFDPIVIFAAIFVRLFGNSLESTIVFEFLWYLAFLFFLATSVLAVNIKEKKEQKIKLVLFIVGIAVFSRGILTGVLFPVHPTFWSIIPLFFICKYVKQQNLKGIFFSSLALCFFKEIFAPALIFFSMYYLFEKKWKSFFSIFFLGVSGCIFAFYLRPFFLGDTHDWSKHVLTENIFEKLFIKTLLHREYESAFRLFYPFIIPFYLLYKKEIKKKGFKHFSIPLFFLIVPLFGVHFINGELWFQYSSIILGPLLAILSLSSVPRIILKNKKLLTFTCLLFFINGLNKHRAQWGITIRVLEDFTGTNYMEQLTGSYSRCSLTKENRQTMDKVQKILDQKSLDKKILATGGVIPHIISKGRLIYSLSKHSKIQPFYDILLFEVNKSKNFIYQIQEKRTTKIISYCEKYVQKVHMDNDLYYFVEGKFPSSCL